jgi:hypothetical protein
MARESLPGLADESYDALLTCDQVLLSKGGLQDLHLGLSGSRQDQSLKEI